MENSQKSNEVVSPTPRKQSRFFTRKSDLRRETTKLIKFSKFYKDTKLWQKILICIGVGLIMSIVSVLFTESTGLYVGGLSSFFQGTARFTRSALLVHQKENGLTTRTINLIYTLMFWGQYLAVNVGLFFLAWKKIGHEFAILSLCYIATLQGMGFAFDQIPVLQSINIFGDTSTVNGILKMCQVKSIVFNPNNFYIINESNQLELLSELIDKQAVIHANITRSISLAIYAAIYAVLHATCASILLIIGSSTAGSDIISVYVSYKKNKSVGTMMLIINGIGLVLGVLIGSYFSGIVVGAAGGFVDNSGNPIATNAGTFAGIQYLFSANLIGSIVWVVLFTLCVDKFFPWKKFAKVQIITSKSKEISKHLFGLGYQHPVTNLEAHGAYSKTKIDVSMFICQMVEVPKLISHIREVDPSCMITSEIVDDMDGSIAILRHTK